MKKKNKYNSNTAIRPARVRDLRFFEYRNRVRSWRTDLRLMGERDGPIVKLVKVAFCSSASANAATVPAENGHIERQNS